MIVAISTSQKKLESSDRRWAQGALAPNQADRGSARACDRPTAPKPTPTMKIRSFSEGMRAFSVS
ncbi:hypothetical protein D3C87_1989650 [compost metagenome]